MKANYGFEPKQEENGSNDNIEKELKCSIMVDGTILKQVNNFK
jgi:hypothetical protein